MDVKAAPKERSASWESDKGSSEKDQPKKQSTSGSPGDAALPVYDPCPSALRNEMRDFDSRLKSFTTKKWNAKLTKSPTCNPLNMAKVGWFCTASDSARCYACFKDLEGWDPKDDPEAEHTSHCQNCPLIVLKVPPLSKRTWKQQLQLDTAIEFFYIRMIKDHHHINVHQAFCEAREALQKKIENLRNGIAMEEVL